MGKIKFDHFPPLENIFAPSGKIPSEKIFETFSTQTRSPFSYPSNVTLATAT